VPSRHPTIPARPDLPRQVQSVTVTHTGPVFRVESCEVVDREGRIARRDIVRHPGAVTVIPVLDDGRLVVIRNERIAVNERLLEFCAGKLEPGEDPAAAAGRELEEECGFRAAQIEPLGMFYTSPGFADERMYVFLATGLTAVPRRLEPGEEIDVETCSLEDLRHLIARGELRDGKSLGALMLWQARLTERPADGLER
jgi:ADP-ribose pyrophosphatase